MEINEKVRALSIVFITLIILFVYIVYSHFYMSLTCDDESCKIPTKGTRSDGGHREYAERVRPVAGRSGFVS